MKIAIHKSIRKGYFSDRWITYCEEKRIPFKVVNCYDSDIVKQLNDCNALMWHFSHGDARDFLFAKQLIKSLEEKELIIMPNLNSCWHFDDKVAQKYLFESLKINSPETFVFYEKEEAKNWVNSTSFPKVFKLRGGAGSGNVFLVKNARQATKIINKSFGRGFRQFNRNTGVIDSFQRLVKGEETLLNFFKAAGKLFVYSNYEKTKGKERGYVYFQEFLPENKFDIRVIVIGQKAFAIKRLVRENDFRASGSGKIIYSKDEIDNRCVKLAFDYSKRIGSNCLAYDFVFNKENQPLVVEVSFGFASKAYYQCDGYWDNKMNWHPGSYFPEDWMVDLVVDEIKKRDQL